MDTYEVAYEVGRILNAIAALRDHVTKSFTEYENRTYRRHKEIENRLHKIDLMLAKIESTVNDRLN